MVASDMDGNPGMQPKKVSLPEFLMEYSREGD